jgi:CheY-like chemotaxis protein
VRSLVTEILESSGYQVLVAADGAAALDLLDETTTPVDLLLTDVVMPRLGGAELADQFAARSPGTRIVFVSGYAEPPLDGDALGGANMLTKPLRRSELLDAVRDALVRAR